MRRPSGLFSSPATTPRLHHSQGSGQHLQRRRAIRITFTVLVSSYLLAAVCYFYPQQRIAANAACPPELAICGELRGDPPAEDGFPSRFVYYEPQFLRGQLDVISQGHLSRNFDCGWGSNHSEAATFVRSPPSATPARSPAAVAQPTAEPSNQLSGSNGRVSATAQLPMTFAGFLPGVTVPTLFGSPATTSWVSGKLLFLAVPDGWSFQHFVDGALPKLVQAKTFIQAPEVKILMDIRSLVPIVGQLLKRLGVDESRALWSGIKQYVQAEELMLTCVTPPFHPQLWREAQAMLGVNQLPRSARSVIAYITRNAASGINGGRVVAKEAELLDAIRALLASRKAEDRSLHEELVVYRHERYRNLEDDLAFWAGVKAVIGPHGGAFTNMVFVPQGALVIEFFPVDVASNRPPYPIGEGNPGHMYQTQAAMLEHDYYFIKADSRADLMEVDSKQVISESVGTASKLMAAAFQTYELFAWILPDEKARQDLLLWLFPRLLAIYSKGNAQFPIQVWRQRGITHPASG
ncbi:hypothetical protein WJX72_005900 [[Myrmecia] bisecta]|uniref:Glycosyltransferase 61 catalytic domain-containing protein n=1 Tax=[Myrmecia] bisecta TaxID=41462 RepID=A0AAW1PIJ6_9CHLO